MIRVYLEKSEYNNKLVIEDVDQFQARIIDNTFAGIELNGNDVEEKVRQYFLENSVASLDDIEEGYVFDFYLPEIDAIIIYDEEKEKKEQMKKIYELYKCTGVFDDPSQIERGCCGRYDDEGELIAAFETEEEAILALNKHRSSVKRSNGDYIVTEYYVSIVVCDEYGDPDYTDDMIEQEIVW